MPDPVITILGARNMLARLVNGTWVDPLGTLTFGVFVNNVFPALDTTLAQMSSAGIAPSDVAMDGDAWTEPIQVGSRWRTFYQNDPTEFGPFVLSLTVYGYYVFDPQANVLLWAQRFDTPIPLNNGQVVAVRPFLDFGQCP